MKNKRYSAIVKANNAKKDEKIRIEIAKKDKSRGINSVGGLFFSNFVSILLLFLVFLVVCYYTFGLHRNSGQFAVPVALLLSTALIIL